MPLINATRLVSALQFTGDRKGMAQMNVEAKLTSVGNDGYVSAEDVLFLRRNVFFDGVVCKQELNALFKLGERAPDGDIEWRQYFAEAAADHYLREEEPQGYLTDAEFQLLKMQVTRDGGQASALEMELLIHLLKNAVSSPTDMSEFIADQFRSYVANKKNGPQITERDAELMRDYLYAAGGAGTVGITKEEAELLFDLHDMTADAENHPSWSDLFIKAIAAHLMQHVGYQPLAREEALRLNDWAKDTSINPIGFFGRMFSGGLSSVRESYGRKSVRAQRNDEDEIAAQIAEQVTAREADWLADRIGRDGRVHDLEQALIAYMRDLDADLPPKLRALVKDAA